MNGCGAEPADKRLIVNADHNRICAILMENGRAAEFYLELRTNEGVLGNIYRGRVQNILPGMSAAFIDIGEEKNAFMNIGESESTLLHLDGEAIRLSDNKDAKLKIGQDVMVQAVKEPYGSKGARVSTNITLAGRTVVYIPNADFAGVSKRITDESERERLKCILHKIKPDGAGIIARTSAAGCDEAVIKNDMIDLIERMDSVRRAFAGSRSPKLIYSEASLMGRIFRDMMKPDVQSLAINNGIYYEKFYKAAEQCGLAERVEGYEEDRDPFKTLNVEKQIEEALSRRVWLKSGAYIVIDQTEALVSIDVNTGKNTGKAAPKKVIVDTNCEAASEIAHQIRLRNLSGIIVIDFIDMPDKADRDRVVSALKEAFRSDGSRTTVYGMTHLGLVELARRKSGKTLSEILCSDCQCCRGAGRLISANAAALRLLDRLRLYREAGARRFKISAAPAVIEAVSGMKNIAEQELLFEADDALRNEEFKIKVCDSV